MLGVEVWWGDVVEVAVVAFGQLPSVVVDDAVMVRAEQGGVIQAGGPAGGPGCHVVGLAPSWRPVAAREAAAAVAGDQRMP